MAASTALHHLPAFQNEPYADFTIAENRQAMERAVAAVRAQMGREYPVLLAGQERHTADKLRSVNPSHPSETVGLHAKATVEMAREAVAAAASYYPTWSRTPAVERIGYLLKAADLLRQRKFEFNAWLVVEAGKTFAEAEGETAEAIDFCEYYARQMVRYAEPQETVQMPGERDQLEYLPLGVGVVIPPWNFALAILAGMTVAALVTGNTVVLKPSSETPTVAAIFAQLLIEAGFPPQSFSLLPGSGAEVGDPLVMHPLTRFIAFTGSRDVGLRIVELAAKHQRGQKWIKRVIAEMGGKDAIVVDADTDVDTAVQGVLVSAFGYQGQKCSACSRAIVHEAIYDEFLAKLKAKTDALAVGPTDDPTNYIGPIISSRAEQGILDYIEVGKAEGRLLSGGAKAQGDGYFVQPTIFADIEPDDRIFQEEIFGPVLGVTKAQSFDEALAMANDSEYGLTGAVYTNDPAKIEQARREFFVGNLYINRKCTGAMVGAHPFGGFNMSGTDTKAGGPDYLLQFLQGKSIAENMA